MYFITGVECSAERVGACRCWGYYLNKDDAIRALNTNATDMWEFCYDYAVLECYEEGVPAECVGALFFKYDKEKDGYFEIEKPWQFEGLSNFGLG